MTLGNPPSGVSISQKSDVSPWPLAIASVGVALAVLFAIYWETIGSMVAIWRKSDTYSYGFLVFPMALYLAIEQRRRIAQFSPAPRPGVLIVLLAVTACWLLAYLVDVQVMQQASLVLVIGALVWATLGSRAALLLAFPVGYLLLAVPIWSIFIPVLQEYTAVMATRTLRAMGVPVFLDGIFISIPSGNFVVEEVCAGLRYLLATMCVVALYAYLNCRALWRVALILVFAAGVSILFNWLRVVVIVLAGHLSEMQHPLVNEHIWFGWVMFGVALVPMFLLGAWLRERAPEDEVVSRRTHSSPSNPSNVVVVAVSAVVLSACAPLTARWLDSVEVGESGVSMPSMPVGKGEWAGPLEASGDWRPKFNGADFEKLVSYGSGARRVTLYLAYYHAQKQDSELINDTNTVYGTEKVRPLRTNRVELTEAHGRALTLKETEVRNRIGETRIIWHLYLVGERSTTNPYVAKLLQAWSVLTGRPGSAVVAVSTNTKWPLEEARPMLADFMQQMSGPIFNALALSSPSGS